MAGILKTRLYSLGVNVGIEFLWTKPKPRSPPFRLQIQEPHLLCINSATRPSDPFYRRPCNPNRGIGLNFSLSHRVGWGGGGPVAAALVLVPLLTIPPSLDRCCIRAQLVALCSAAATDATQRRRDDNDDDNNTTTRQRRETTTSLQGDEETTTRRQ